MTSLVEKISNMNEKIANHLTQLDCWDKLCQDLFNLDENNGTEEQCNSILSKIKILETEIHDSWEVMLKSEQDEVLKILDAIDR